MQKRVIINRGDTDVRVAFLEEGKLVEFHRESLTEKSIVGNIYRGVVQDVIPGLQAAFVDIGMGRNVFLHFMDVRPESLVLGAEDLDSALREASETVIPGRITQRGRRPRPDPRAHDVPPPIKPGDSLVVQVVKAEISDKAPRVTTNLALAGRYLVLLPFPGQSGGVSRKVAMGEDRMKLKKLLHDLRTDQYSFIVRTAGVGAEEDQIRTDVDTLRSQWESMLAKYRSLKGPGLVYSDQDFILRLVRDVFTEDIDEIVCDDSALAEELRLSLERTLNQLADRVVDYDGHEPVFQHFLVENQLRKALHRKVWLKSGGYLIIDEMEALTAIDVNTGRFTGSKDQERTSLRTNLEACEAVGQQIRLRDIGGIIVIDFIDMLTNENQTKVADELRRQLRNDRSKMSIGRIGDFGLMILTRKRKHMSLQKQVFDVCPYCEGDGMVLKPSEVWRRIHDDLSMLADTGKTYSAAIVCCAPEVASALRGEYAEHVGRFEQSTRIALILREQTGLHLEDYTVTGVEMPKHGTVHLPKRRIPETEVMQPDIPFEDLSEEEMAELTNPTPGEAPRAQQAGARPSRRDADVGVNDPSSGHARIPREGGQADADSERRRTRRGHRGGRRRRGRGRDEAQVGNNAPPNGNPQQHFDDDDNRGNRISDPPMDAHYSSRSQRSGQHQGGARPPRPPRPPRDGQQPQAPAPPMNAAPQQRPPRPPRPERQPEPARAAVPAAPVQASAPSQPSQAAAPKRSSKLQIVAGWGPGVTAPKTAPAPAAPKPAPAVSAPAVPAPPRQLRSVQVISAWGGGAKSATSSSGGDQRPAAASSTGSLPTAARRAPSREERRRAREQADAAATGAASTQVAAPEPARVMEAPRATEPAPTVDPAVLETKPAAKARKPAVKAAKKAAVKKAAAPAPAKKAAKKAAAPKKPAAKPAAKASKKSAK